MSSAVLWNVHLTKAPAWLVGLFGSPRHSLPGGAGDGRDRRLKVVRRAIGHSGSLFTDIFHN
jgi:hypothetical protein